MEFKATISNTFVYQLYHGGQFWFWRKPEYLEKTTDRPAASHSQTLSHNVASSPPRHEWDSSSQLFKLTTVVVIGLIAQVVVNPTTIRSRP